MPTEYVDRIRQKYPGAYDDLSDQELASLVLQKYPQYRDVLGDVAYGAIKAAPGFLGRTLERAQIAQTPWPLKALSYAAVPYLLGVEGLATAGMGYPVSPGLAAPSGEFRPDPAEVVALGLFGAKGLTRAGARLAHRPFPGYAQGRVRPTAPGATTVEPGGVGPAAAARPRISARPTAPGATSLQITGVRGVPLQPEADIGGRLLSRVPGLRIPSAIAGWLFSPVASALERLGGEGREAARLLTLTHYSAMGWLERNIIPLYTQLRRLTPTQRRQFFRMAHEGEKATDPQVLQLFPQYEALFGVKGLIPRELESVGAFFVTRGKGGKLIAEPFQAAKHAREQFFPLEYHPSTIHRIFSAGGKPSPEIVQELIRTGQAASEAEARWMVTNLFRRSTLGLERYSPAEFARRAEMKGFTEDPAEAVMMRGWNLARRLSELRLLGPRQERLRSLVTQLEQRDPSAAQRLQHLLDIAYTGKNRFISMMDHELIRRGVQLGMAWQAFTHLPLATIANASQPTIIGLRTNMLTAARAFFTSLGRPMQARELAREIGATANIAARQIMQEYTGGFGGRMLSYSLRLFNAVERFNLRTTSVAGNMWATRLERLLAAGPTLSKRNVGWLQRELQRLNFSRDEIAEVLALGKWRQGDRQRVMMSLVDQTQFIPHGLRRSEFFNSDVGRALGQFKTFAMNLGRTLHRSYVDEVRYGNYQPLVTLLVYVGLPMNAIGEVVRDVQAMATRRARPSLREEPIKRMIENVTAVGGLALATDFLYQIAAGGIGGPFTGLVGGPSMDDIDRVLSRGFSLGKAALTASPDTLRQLYESARLVAGQTPYMGGFLTREALPSSTRGREERPRSAEELLGFGGRATRRARIRRAERERRHRQLRRQLGQ